jgi:hypothetical protein
MFIAWTIGTIWLLLVFDQTQLSQSINTNSTSFLLLLLPTSGPGLILAVSWIIPLLLLVYRFFFPSNQTIPLASLNEPGNMKPFDWLLIISTILLAAFGWATGATALLLLSTIAATGLSLNKFEQWLIR